MVLGFDVLISIVVRAFAIGDDVGGFVLVEETSRLVRGGGFQFCVVRIATIVV